ncbi:MAG: hypothetical protein Q4C91_22115 [Eubacteriales bacterium]|nr:hypothetical protein [Eubacteriales bacterium]
MDIDTEVYGETMELFLDTLMKRTLDGKQVWDNLGYLPARFMLDDRWEEQEGEVSNLFCMETSFKGREYSLKLSESIELLSMKGNIYGILNREDDGKSYEFALSLDGERYKSASAEELRGIYADSLVVNFADMVVEYFGGFPEVIAAGYKDNAYYCNEFFEGKKVEKKWKKMPVVKLGEKLFQEKRMMDFHKIILDTEYRKKLLEEEL